MKEIEKPAPTGLGVQAMLGFPAFGRTTPTLPLTCVVFQEEGYAGPQQTPRLGQVQPAGTQIAASLFVVGNNEQELLRLVDTLSDVKASLAAVTVDDAVYVVRYSPTRRTGIELPEYQLNFVAETQITFTRKER